MAINFTLNNSDIGDKNIFLIMVGPSGSGKSTIAKEIKTFLESKDIVDGRDRRTLVLSSDSIRDELYGTDREYDKSKNQEVFALLHRRIKDMCGDCNIIIDATNLTIKTRASLINCTKKSKDKIYYIAYVMTTFIENCKVQNAKREGVARVPEEVIIKHAKAFEIPILEEGFNSIQLSGYTEKMISSFKEGWNLKQDKLFQSLVGFDQKNPHHLYTLDKHTMNVLYGIIEWGRKNKIAIPKYLMRAATLHDIGKLYVGEPLVLEDGTINNDHYRYKGHANYGTYMLLNHLQELGFNNMKDILDCLTVINYHMEPFAWRVEQKDGRKIVLPKTVEKMKKRYGRYYNIITFFNIFDKKATGTETDTGDDEFFKPKKKKKEKVKPQGLTKKQKKQLKKQAKKERKRLKREKEKAKIKARQEWLTKRKIIEEQKKEQ